MCRWEFWRLVPERKGTRTLRCKVVKVVSLEVPPLKTTRSDSVLLQLVNPLNHHGEAVSGETSVFETERARCFSG